MALCKQCGQPDHGTAACNTVNDDKPIYNEAMDTIAELNAALAERDKRIEAIDKALLESRRFNQALKEALEHHPTNLLLQKKLEDAEVRVKELDFSVKCLSESILPYESRLSIAREGLEEIIKFKGTDIMFYINIFDKVMKIAEQTLERMG